MAARRKPNPNSAREVIDRAHIEVSKQSLEQLKTVAAMQSTLSSLNKDAVKMLGLIHTQLDSMSGGAAAGAGAGSVPFFGGMMGGGGGYAPGPNGGRPTMPPDQTRRPSMGAGGYPGGHGYGMNGAQFGGYGGQMGGMGGMFGAAQSGAARFVHNRWGFGASPSGMPSAVHYQRMNDGSYSSFDAGGNAIEHGISEATYARRMAVSGAAARGGSAGNIIGALRGGLGGLGEAGGGLGKLAMGAGGVVGGALMGAEAVHQFGNFVGNQRAANAQYQAIYGPGTSGFDERLHNWGGRFRNLMSNIGSVFGLSSGGLSDGDYDKAFKQISGMGYGGTNRNNMIGFATQNFNKLGMSVDDSLALIGINAKTAASSFADLQDKLKAVSETAQQTGQSAVVLRQSFTQNYQSAVSAGFGGGSAVLAQAQVAATAGQGRPFAGLNTAAMFSTPGGAQVLASTAGFSNPLDFSLASQADPRVAANAQDSRLNQLFGSAVPTDVQALVKQYIQKHGGNQNIITNPNAARQVVDDIEKDHPAALGNNYYSILGALKAAGVQGVETLSDQDVAAYYVKWVAGGGKMFSKTAAQGVSDLRQLSSGNTKDKAGSQTAIVAAAKNQAIKKFFGGSGDLASNVVGGKTFSVAGMTTTVGGTAVYDPIIQKLQHDKVQLVTVTTKDGPTVVSLSDAAKNYRDQLVNGTAIIASGPDQGQAISAVYGTERNAKYKDTTGTAAKGGVFDSKTQKAINAAGLTDSQISQLAGEYGAYKKYFGTGDADKIVAKQIATATAKNSDAQGGNIMVGLTADASQYLQVTTSGGNLVNQSAASGTAPAVPSTGSSTGH